MVFCVRSVFEVFAIWGMPMRSSIISMPRAVMAKAPAGVVVMPISVKMPTMPNSWMPVPAGVMGTNASAVTSGCMRKYPIHGICVMPSAKPRKYHSKPFSIQHARVRIVISGMALRFFFELSLNSSSLPISPPVNLLMNFQFAMRWKSDSAFCDQVMAASTIAPTSISVMPNPATRSPSMPVVC